MIKLYICCLVLIIGSVEVDPDIDLKFHQDVMEVVSYDIVLRLQCLNVVPSDSTHQCQVNTAPSQIDALVPGFQGPPTANYLSESISIHEINVLFDSMGQMASLGGH